MRRQQLKPSSQAIRPRRVVTQNWKFLLAILFVTTKASSHLSLVPFFTPSVLFTFHAHRRSSLFAGNSFLFNFFEIKSTYKKRSKFARSLAINLIRRDEAKTGVIPMPL